MRARLINAFVLAGALTAQDASADTFNEIALRRNLLDLMDNRGAPRIFTAPKIAYLRNLAKGSTGSTGRESGADIDRLLRNNTQIEISISPEAKLSATRAAASPPKNSCGEETSLLIRISNQSYITSTINVHAGDRFAEKLLAIDPISPALSGAGVEYRILTIHPKSRGPVEISLRFDAGPSTSDLGGRSTLPLLLMCEPAAASHGIGPYPLN